MADLDLAEKLLRELFTLPQNEIHAKMSQLGITGFIGESRSCVVANYIKQQTGVVASVCSIGTTIIDNGVADYIESEGDFGNFIRQFDSCSYPDLLAPYYDD